MCGSVVVVLDEEGGRGGTGRVFGTEGGGLE